MPVEMHWVCAEMGWLEKLFKNGLKNFRAGQYLLQAQPEQAEENGKLPHNNPYLLFSGNPATSRQRRPRACDSRNPLSRGRVQLGERVHHGGQLTHGRAPVARGATAFDAVKRKQEERLTLREAIEKEVFPTLHSFEIYKKLENGALLTQHDAYQKKM